MFVSAPAIMRRNCFLMSSLVQKFDKCGQKVWAHPILWHSAWEYECVQHKDFVNDQVEKLTIFRYRQPKDKNTGEGYRC